MKHLPILFLSLFTLVSCDNALMDLFDETFGAEEEAAEGDEAATEEGAEGGEAAAMTACDCIEAALKVDMYDNAAIAAFEEEYAACEEVMTFDADYSACEDAMAELMGM